MRDENQRAFDAVQQATGGDVTGPEVLAEIIGALREGIKEGASDEELALRVWPRVARVIGIAENEALERPGLDR